MMEITINPMNETVAMVRMEVSSVMSLAIGSIMRISQTRISNFLKVANIHSSNTYCRVKLLSFGSHEVIVRQRLMNNRWVVPLLNRAIQF